MRLPSEMLRAFLPPRTVGTERVVSTACGHPAPLLIRDQAVVPDALERDADVPMDMPSLLASAPPKVHEIAVRPRDRVLMYTDGVTEAWTQDGSLFGLERFADYVIRATAGGELAPETLRRLIHSLLDASTHLLRDDATILMSEWEPVAR